jgi:ComF family protein
MFPASARFIQSLLDIILPRKDRIVRIEDYSLDTIAISPVEHEMCGMRITTLMRYRDRTAEDLIRALKYDRSQTAARLLAGILAEYLREEIANIRSFSTREILLVPIPLHISRIRQRGFNQIEKIFSSLPEEYKDGTLSRVSYALVRTRATPQQTRLSRTKRLENVRGAFARTSDVSNAHYIIIDDVTTTGATLSEAAKPFVGEKVTLLALSHA